MGEDNTSLSLMKILYKKTLPSRDVGGKYKPLVASVRGHEDDTSYRRTHMLET